MTRAPVVPYLEYTEEVHDALERGAPVVALESTIISHGMPYPQNVTTAREVESLIRESGAVPATIAVLHGMLKVGLTLEKLETLGVPVIAFGTSEFPAFFSRNSGFQAPLRADSAGDVARILRAKWDLGLQGGALIANPIPAESEIPASEIDPIIREALSEMSTRGISGKDATPFLLGRIVELTGGRSLRANIALVKNNARVASAIARRLEALD